MTGLNAVRAAEADFTINLTGGRRFRGGRRAVPGRMSDSEMVSVRRPVWSATEHTVQLP
jgi:hypothetical protein